MDFNKDELEPPPWMNNDFFRDVLETCQNESILKIKDVTITPATVKGDHYASVMFRAIVRYLDSHNFEKDISLIIKTMPDEEGTKKDFLSECKIFETEITMYQNIIPKFEEMLRSIGDETVLGAKMLYSSLQPRKLIVFEDICRKGFVTVGKRMANLEEVKLSLDKLAKWHAASFMYNSQPENANELEDFVDGVFNMPASKNHEVFTSGIEQLIKVLKDLPGFEIYLPKLQKLSEQMVEKCQQSYEMCKIGGLNVLNHGDLHGKNMMYQYDGNGKAQQAMLVDFQLCVWGSMAIDILYWSYMLLDVEMRKKHLDTLRYEFFSNFIATLKALGFKGKLPRYTDLLIDMVKLNHVEIFLTCTFLPYMHCIDMGMELDPALIMESEEYRHKVFRLPSYIEEMKSLLPTILNKGYLDE